MKEDTIRKAAEKESIQQEKAEIDKIIALYNNAKTGNPHISNQENREIPFLIVGRQEDLNWCLSTVAQAASNPDVYRDRCNFNTSNDRQSGEYMNIEKWTIFKNKIWLIGAIEAGIDFYLTKKGGFKSLEDIFSITINRENQWYPVTVTCIELISLLSFGYEPTLLPDCSICLRRTLSRGDIDSFDTYEKCLDSQMNGVDGKVSEEKCWQFLKNRLQDLFQN